MGLCVKDECQLFKKVIRMLPKFKRYYELMAQGVCMTTLWDFSGKAMATRRRQQVKARRWMNEYYPNILKGLNGRIIQKNLTVKDS